MANAQLIIAGVIAVVIGVILITSQAVTIQENTASNDFNASGVDEDAGQLQNVSADALALYGLYDLVWAAGGLILTVAGIFAVAAGAKNLGKF